MIEIKSQISHPSGAITQTAASPWVKRFVSLAPAGQILDLACGYGRHASWLLSEGNEVVALDRNTEMLSELERQGARIVLHDLEPDAETADWPFADNLFAAIIVCNYLHRPLFPHLLASLKPGGILIYETFALGNALFGKPSNPHFLLKPGELFHQMASNPSVAMQVIAYEEGFIQDPKPAMVQRICSRKAPQGTENDVL
ncbi:class I SAM-dependent methyltransferase [Undibacterium sp. RuRC25W]|uniref:class I SAM-dependent methyltransferase n=1 Tax=Undibacterium sp. RuRC25W TaxID=3413047 RepID=UPI003BF0536C